MVIFNSFLYVFQRVNSDGWAKNVVTTAVTTTVVLRLGGTVETRLESQKTREFQQATTAGFTKPKSQNNLKEQDPYIGLKNRPYIW
jgi:hypothetical protein